MIAAAALVLGPPALLLAGMAGAVLAGAAALDAVGRAPVAGDLLRAAQRGARQAERERLLRERRWR